MFTNGRRQARLALALVCVLFLTLALAGPVAAFDGRSQETIMVREGEVINDDLILIGKDIVVNGTVNGDLLAFGNNVTVNGKVNGSLVLAARMATLNAAVSGSVYGGAAALVFGPNAAVGRNVYCGAYSIETAKGSLVKRDALLAAYQVILGGELARDAAVAAAALELNGAVGGDVKAAVGDPSGQGMRYWSPSQGLVEFGWRGRLRVCNEFISLRGYKRFDNPYCQAEFADPTMTIYILDQLKAATGRKE